MVFNCLRFSGKLFQCNVHDRQGLTSTPADQPRHKTQTNILMSPIPMFEPVQNVNYEELSKQVNKLSEVVKTLQGQINKIQDFMSELSKKYRRERVIHVQAVRF